LRVLLDSCIWPGAKEQIARAGHEVEWVGDWPTDPGDAEILAHAAHHQQVIVTLDKDFGELAVAFSRPHAGIVRLVDVRHQRQGPLSLELLARHGEALAQGAIVTAEPSRVRVRSGP
jgi:predicted nuclease of predicted toxin-antitoxin system